jgi:aspartate/glutamate racemase
MDEPLPILDMVELTIRSVITDQQVSQIGLLTTNQNRTVPTNYGKNIKEELNTRPIKMILPNAEGQCVVDD